MEYEHKGTKIQFSEQSAEFTALIAGKVVRATSLASIKKKIEAANTFQPFNALREVTWSDKTKANYIEVRVVGIQKPRGKTSWSNRPEWLCEGSRSVRAVWEDTPENRAAIDAHVALQKANRAAKEKAGAEEREAQAKIKVLVPQ